MRIQVAETATLNAQMTIGALTETVNVSAEATQADFTTTSTVAASYRSDLIDTLPVGRGIEGAVLLAPGTARTGPNGNVTFSGAMSYEGLFLLNGVVLNETLRGQSRALFIEDAIEETKTSTGTISAEYGRFAGGVANTITKSGGNMFQRVVPGHAQQRLVDGPHAVRQDADHRRPAIRHAAADLRGDRRAGRSCGTACGSSPRTGTTRTRTATPRATRTSRSPP